tara:strand:- start:278 stop:847 length:570 start_codon:yes stop_codon:yes gene_type:complete
MLELGILIFIVIIILYIILFTGVSKKTDTKKTDTKKNVMGDNSYCKTKLISPNGHCGYIAIMYALKQLKNKLFMKNFTSLSEETYIDGKLKYPTESVQLFYNLIVNEAILLTINENEIKRIGNGKCIKEIDSSYFVAISNKFKVNIHIHNNNMNTIKIPEQKLFTDTINLLFKTGNNTSSGHYDLLECS